MPRVEKIVPVEINLWVEETRATFLAAWMTGVNFIRTRGNGWVNGNPYGFQ